MLWNIKDCIPSADWLRHVASSVGSAAKPMAIKPLSTSLATEKKYIYIYHIEHLVYRIYKKKCSLLIV